MALVAHLASLSCLQVRQERDHTDGLRCLHGRAGLLHWGEAQHPVAVPHGSQIGPGSFLWPLQPLPVQAGGPREVARSQERHPEPVGPDAEAHEDARCRGHAEAVPAPAALQVPGSSRPAPCSPPCVGLATIPAESLKVTVDALVGTLLFKTSDFAHPAFLCGIIRSTLQTLGRESWAA